MPFTAQLDLDEETNAALDKLAERLDRISGLETERSIGDVHHMSLGVYDDLPVERFVTHLARFAETLEPIAIQLASIGVFPGARSVVYLGPVVTDELLAVHSRFHDALAGFSATCWEHYQPKRWVPHVTLALNVESGALESAVTELRAHWHPGAATLDALRLIRFRPVETLYRRALA